LPFTDYGGEFVDVTYTLRIDRTTDTNADDDTQLAITGGSAEGARESAETSPEPAPQSIGIIEGADEAPPAVQDSVQSGAVGADSDGSESTGAGSGPSEWKLLSPPQPPVLNIRAGVTAFLPGADFAVQMNDNTMVIGTAAVTGQPAGLFGYHLELDRDSLLANRFLARVIMKLNIFSLEAGPAIGFLNNGTGVSQNASRDAVSPGLTFLLGMSLFKDRLSLALRFDTSLIGTINNVGEYSQELREASVAYQLTFGRVSFTLNERELSRMDFSWAPITNRWTQYRINVDAVPAAWRGWGAGLSTAWQRLTWFNNRQGERASYWNICLGASASYRITNGPTLNAAFELPLYPFSYGKKNATMLWGISLGMRWAFKSFR
jgi:hypothetical protein